MKARAMRPAATRAIGEALESLGPLGELHPLPDAGEDHDGTSRKPMPPVTPYTTALNKAVAVLGVLQHHAQHSAVGGDQGQVHTQGLIEGGHGLLAGTSR